MAPDSKTGPESPGMASFPSPFFFGKDVHLCLLHLHQICPHQLPCLLQKGCLLHLHEIAFYQLIVIEAISMSLQLHMKAVFALLLSGMLSFGIAMTLNSLNIHCFGWRVQVAQISNPVCLNLVNEKVLIY